VIILEEFIVINGRKYKYDAQEDVLEVKHCTVYINGEMSEEIID